MAKASGVSFPKDKEYLYTYALTQNPKISNYIVELIEADYNNTSRLPKQFDVKAINDSIDVIQKEILHLRKLLS